MKNSFALFIAKFLDKFSILFLTIVLAQVYGKNELGEYAYLNALAIFVFVLFNAGGEFFHVKVITEEFEINKIVNVFYLKTILFFFFFCVSIILISQNIFQLLLVAYYLEAINIIFTSVLYVKQQFVFHAGFKIIEKSILICILFLSLFFHEDVVYIYILFSFSKLTYFILNIHLLKQRVLIKKEQLNFNLLYLKEYLKKSWSYTLNAFLVIAFVQLDLIILRYLNIQFDEIGIYAAATKILIALNIIPETFLSQYYPKIVRFIEENKNLPHFINEIQALSSFLILIVTIPLTLFSEELITLFYGDGFISTIQILILLLVIIPFRFNMYPFTAILAGSEYNYLKLYSSIFCSIFSIIFSIILIPEYGIWGAAIVRILTEIILLSSFIYFVKIKINIHISISSIFTLLFVMFWIAMNYYFYPEISPIIKISIFSIFIILLFFKRNRILKLVQI